MSAMSDLAAVTTLCDATAAIGLPMYDEGADFLLTNPAGGRLRIEIKRLSLAAADGLSRRIAEWNRQLPDGVVGVLVADRITQGARDILNAAGWGWLDLRGHLRIVGAGLFIDADVPADKRNPVRADPFAGRVGREVAAALLLHPDHPAGVRELATALGRSASSVSEVLTRMRDTGLVDAQAKPVVPELFWQLAEHWRSSEVDVLVEPRPGERLAGAALRVGLTDVEHEIGWALGDTMAAAAYGAPVGVRAHHPPDLYVPDDTTLRRAARLLGTAPSRASRAATIRLAPVPAVCAHRVDASGFASALWPLAQPLFVALDLARDPGRGREILAGWTPDGRWRRVW